MPNFLANLSDLKAKSPLASNINDKDLTVTMDITIEPTQLEFIQSSISTLTQSLHSQGKQLQQVICCQKMQVALNAKQHTQYQAATLQAHTDHSTSEHQLQEQIQNIHLDGQVEQQELELCLDQKYRLHHKKTSGILSSGPSQTASPGDQS